AGPGTVSANALVSPTPSSTPARPTALSPRSAGGVMGAGVTGAGAVNWSSATSKPSWESESGANPGGTTARAMAIDVPVERSTVFTTTREPAPWTTARNPPGPATQWPAVRTHVGAIRVPVQRTSVPSDR